MIELFTILFIFSYTISDDEETKLKKKRKESDRMYRER